MRTNFAGVFLAAAGWLPASAPAQITNDNSSWTSPGGASYLGPTGLRRGVNFGNMLEAPNEGDWGLTVREEFFDRVVEAKLDHVRLPVSWTSHASKTPPYTIDPVFLARVDWCVDRALQRGLKIIVNVHHYDELNDNPTAETPRALAIWSQIAARFKDRPPSVLFEVLNEPHGAFNDNPELWNTYLAQAVSSIRATNPTRWILAGPVRWNSIYGLPTFNPPADRKLLTTVHYYDPFDFTHQGAEWIDPPPPVGRTWDPATVTIAAPWFNWSWDTLVQPTATGIQVTYARQWAGVYLHREPALSDVRRVQFRVDRAVNLLVSIGAEGAEQDFWFQSAAGGGEFTADLPSGSGPVERMMIKNPEAGSVPPFVVSDVRVLAGSGVERALAMEAELIERAFDAAVAWSKNRRMPLHLGEFGAYSAADMDSRAAWTRTVRTVCERRGIPWSYWELAAGFGFYDPEAGQWRQPLLNALTGP